MRKLYFAFLKIKFLNLIFIWQQTIPVLKMLPMQGFESACILYKGMKWYYLHNICFTFGYIITNAVVNLTLVWGNYWSIEYIAQDMNMSFVNNKGQCSEHFSYHEQDIYFVYACLNRKLTTVVKVTTIDPID